MLPLFGFLFQHRYDPVRSAELAEKVLQSRVTAQTDNARKRELVHQISLSSTPC
jgi:hypothetical protein